MAYATIADVEARLGSVLPTSIQTAVTTFLEDYSAWLDAYLAAYSTPAPVPAPANLTIVVARHGAAFALTVGREGGPNAQSLSQTVGDTTQYIAFRGTSGPDPLGFFLTSADMLLLGLGGLNRIRSIRMVC